MKCFEIGKTYSVNGGGKIAITKKSACYVSFCGDYAGRKKILNHDLFGLGEAILIDRYRFAYAAHELV